MNNSLPFSEEIQRLPDNIVHDGRLPHALLIECTDAEKAAQAAVFLSMYAVCAAADKPCGACKNCRNARNRAHADVLWLPLPPSKKQYSVEQVRALMKDASVLPNEAAAKVYILQNCDEWFSPLAQNTFLKLSEEPPQNIIFILLCKSAQSLLPTILSRFTVLRLKGSASFDEQTLAEAAAIVQGFLDSTEYPLLLAMRCLRDRERAPAVLSAVGQELRGALVLLSGSMAEATPAARQLAARLTRKKLLDMLQLCGKATAIIRQNANNTLLTTWLCGEFRRIIWQR